MRQTARNIYGTQNYLIKEEPRGASQLVEIPVANAGVSNVGLPDVPQLRNDLSQKVIIKAIRLIPNTVLTTGVTQAGANAPLTELQKINLVLYAEGWEKGKNIPILTLNDTFTEGSGIPWKDRTTQLADWEDVDWNKSSMQFGNGQVSAGTPYVVMLEVEYMRLKKEVDNQGKETGRWIEIIGPA